MRLLCFFAILVFSAVANAEEKPFTPEQIGWLQRVHTNEAIGKLKAMRDAGNWCAYEEEQRVPDIRACELAERLRKQSTLRDDALMIRTGIKQLKEAEQTPLIREHIRVLEASMGEIMYNLRSIDAE